MKFQVLSRENARRYSYMDDINKCIIISINGTDEELNQFNPNPSIIDICHVVFDDVEKDEPNCMTRADAEKILAFVNQHINEVDEIIVHCGAGISRSAGVCAALMLIINGSDEAIFGNGKYCPNNNCYRLMLESYFGYYDKKAADEKYRKHLILWRKEYGLDD